MYAAICDSCAESTGGDFDSLGEAIAAAEAMDGERCGFCRSRGPWIVLNLDGDDEYDEDDD